jgi:DNA-binding CsgD family transcriptional regulator
MSQAKDEARLLKLETELDAAVLDGSRWRGVCDALAAATEGAGTAFIPFDASKRAPWLVHSDDLGELVECYIGDGWYKRDAREATLPAMLRRGWSTDHDVGDRDVIRKQPFYADFMARHGFGVFIGIHIPTDRGDWCAAIQRSATTGTPSSTVLERIPRLRAMLTAAARAARAIGASGVENWRAYFDAADRGFALLGRDGRVSEANDTAARLLEPFMGMAGEIVLADSVARMRLAELTARACARAPGKLLPPPVLLPLPYGRTLSIDVAPLPSRLRHFHVDAVALMIVRLAQAPGVDQSAKLTHKFGLTAAEARLAVRIGKGESLRAAADAEAVTYESARTRLKSIFTKTHSNRQAELALLVARINAA